MTIETTIRLSEDQHAFLVQQVADGTYASLDEAIAAAIADMRGIAEGLDPEMISEIRRRLRTPEGDYLPWDSAQVMEEVRRSLVEPATAAK